MASITIRNLEDGLKRQLRIQAAQHGQSVEEEARQILRTALSPNSRDPVDLARAIRVRFAPLGGVDFDLPPREPPREPLRFD
ncbi:MAG: hypothetical protein OXC18_09880 [Desulfurellaceae bacterium]|nr:hypothetical protein [Desulfurellaceae bacterium]